MELSKLQNLFRETFPSNLDVSLLSEKEMIMQLLALDLKTKKLTYDQIRIKYGVSVKIARNMVYLIRGTKKIKRL